MIHTFDMNHFIGRYIHTSLSTFARSLLTFTFTLSQIKQNRGIPVPFWPQNAPDAPPPIVDIILHVCVDITPVASHNATHIIDRYNLD